MGTPLPENPPIEPTKYYLVTQPTYWYTPSNCGGVPGSVKKCCVLGSVLLAWFAAGNDCKTGVTLCGCAGGYVCKVAGWAGPYETFNSCYADR